MRSFRRSVLIAALTLASGVLAAENAWAKNVVVGPDTCEPTIKPVNRFTTIQAAVTAALPGDTVLVCPGLYPEQVLIDKAITLKGTADPSGGNLAVITRPATALIFESLYPDVPNHPARFLAPQVVVTGAASTHAKVLNIAIDGSFEPHSSASCPDPTARTVGILFQSVGTLADGLASGTIGNVAVRNQYYDSCPPETQGIGVLLEDSYVTMSDSTVHSILGDGIVTHGGTSIIQRNFLMDVAGYSMWIYKGTGSQAKTNTIIHTSEGILVHFSASTVVTGNAIGPYVGAGIHLAGDNGSIVQTNRMVYTTTGIFIAESAAATVTGNIVLYSGTGISDNFSFGGTNVIKTNEVNEASVGLSGVGTGTDVLAPNTFTNVAVATQVVP
jgi:hypothetical protein